MPVTFPFSVGKKTRSEKPRAATADRKWQGYAKAFQKRRLLCIDEKRRVRRERLRDIDPATRIRPWPAPRVDASTHASLP